MNKKILLIILSSILLLSIFSSSFILAYTFKDVQSGKISLFEYIKWRLTGKAFLASASCIDSDGGKNYSFKGTTSWLFNNNWWNNTDYCSSDGRLIEIYCPGGAVEYYTCPNGCENGACKVSTQPASNCIDSDGGNNYDIKGYATTDGGTTKSYDICAWEKSTGNTLMETYTLYETSCYSNGSIKTESYRCPNGCESGVCLIPTPPATNTTTNLTNATTPTNLTCTDSDGGKNYIVKGTTTISPGGGSSTDSCSNSTLLREYFCSSTNQVDAINYGCSNGCSNGACTNQTINVTQYSCVDSDNGKNYYTKGTAVVCLGEVCETHLDFCSGGASGKELNEKYCTELPTVQGLPNGVSYAGVIYDCPYRCNDGACLISPTEQSNITQEQGVPSCDGCLLDNKCYSIGYRKSGTYCSDQKSFIGQLEESESCENNFECDSNLCVSGECLSESFLQKIINWFKSLFGG